MKTQPKPRGLAAMTPERRREIASLGGRSVKPENRAFSRDPQLAAEAGCVGGYSKAGVSVTTKRGRKKIELWDAVTLRKIVRLVDRGYSIKAALHEVGSKVKLSTAQARIRRARQVREVADA